MLPGAFGDMERRFRRHFVETHELLGRGHVLEAYSAGDSAYIDRIVARRRRMIEKAMARRGAAIYVDISKYFARGLHQGYARALPSFSLIRLVRDPLLNMRSFLNRNKNFRLDNNLPNTAHNLLPMNGAKLAKGELYLWAWCEMYLRHDRLIESGAVDRSVEIRTEDLNDGARLNAHFDALGLSHTPVEVVAPISTNVSHGLTETVVNADDIALFERFISRLGADVLSRIPYLDGYDPHQSHAKTTKVKNR